MKNCSGLHPSINHAGIFRKKLLHGTKGEETFFCASSYCNPFTYKMVWVNKLSKLADIYTEKYTCARSILLMTPKRLTFTGTHSLSKLPACFFCCYFFCLFFVLKNRCTEQACWRGGKKKKKRGRRSKRTALCTQKDVEIIPNKIGAAPSSRLSKWCYRFISK